MKSRRDINDYYNGNLNVDANDRFTLSKRRESIKPKLPGGTLDLPPLAHPSSGKLYESPRDKNKKEVYDFKDKKVGTITVREFGSLIRPSDEYAVEHIIEVSSVFYICDTPSKTHQLQTLGLFMLYATKQDPKLDGFFRNTFVKPSKADIATRPNPPSYKLGTTPVRDSLMSLVFEAMGSTSNPTDFVLCELEVNSCKARIWTYKAPMETDKYDLALSDAMLGLVPSADFLSGLRLVRLTMRNAVPNDLLTDSLDVHGLQLHELA